MNEHFSYATDLRLQRIIDGMRSDAVQIFRPNDPYALALRDIADKLQKLVPIRPVEQLQLLTEAHQRIAKLEAELAAALEAKNGTR